MRTVTIRWLAALAMLIPVFALAGLSAAQTPEINIPPSAMSAPLGEEHRQVIRAYLQDWASQMKSATSTEQVTQLRRQLAEAFNQYNNPNYRLAFAQLASQELPGLLTEMKEPLKQINLAIALSQMSQVGIQPALDKMVSHPNPAVRFFGWQGYRNIRMLVLAQGPSFIKDMYQAIDTAAAKEQSDCVLRALYPMLAYWGPRESYVNSAAYAEASGRSLDLFAQVWKRQGESVERGEIPAIRSVQVGLRELKAVARARENDPAGQLPVLQMVVSTMQAAAKGYQAVGGEGLAADELRVLLLDIEEAVNLVTKARQQYLRMALDVRGAPDRVDAVLLAADQTWMTELAKGGFDVQAATQSTSPAGN